MASQTTSPARDAGAPPPRDEVLRAIDALVDECRDESLWYLRPGYRPASDVARLRVLDEIQERCGNDLFTRAGMLKLWLSRVSSDGSASS